MPDWVWFRCERCGAVCQRYPNARVCNRLCPEPRPNRLHNRWICGGSLVRCEPPADPELFSPAWLERRAYAAAFARA